MSTDSIVPTTSMPSPALLVLLTRHEALMPRMQAVPGGPVVADVLMLDDVLDRRLAAWSSSFSSSAQPARSAVSRTTVRVRATDIRRADAIVTADADVAQLVERRLPSRRSRVRSPSSASGLRLGPTSRTRSDGRGARANGGANGPRFGARVVLWHDIRVRGYESDRVLSGLRRSFLLRSSTSSRR